MVVVLFCGHGNSYKLKDEEGRVSETKQIESIVPYDALKKSDERDIHDYEIKAILDKAKSNNITLIFDSCYSAGATRRGEDTVYRSSFFIILLLVNYSKLIILLRLTRIKIFTQIYHILLNNTLIVYI